MSGVACQRWRERRPRYRPSGERIRPAEYAVDLLARDRDARAFVEAHHYSGSYVAARLRVGLWRARPTGSLLVGVAVFSVPAQAAAIPRWCGVPATGGVELGRFVLLDEVPGDGESWFLARALRCLRSALPDVEAVLSYSDPVPRAATDGRLVTPGHVGVVYQASNARYLGRSSPRTLHLLPDGRALSPRSLSKIRLGERGAVAAARALVDAGLPPRERAEAPAAWLARVLPLCRRVRHPGNHAYAWAWGALDRRPPPLPYPRRVALEVPVSPHDLTPRPPVGGA